MLGFKSWLYHLVASRWPWQVLSSLSLRVFMCTMAVMMASTYGVGGALSEMMHSMHFAHFLACTTISTHYHCNSTTTCNGPNGALPKICPHPHPQNFWILLCMATNLVKLRILREGTFLDGPGGPQIQSHWSLDETGRGSFESDTQKRSQAHRAGGNVKTEHREMQLCSYKPRKASRGQQAERGKV